MAKDVARIIRNSFWKDEKVVNQFSAEDRYFFAYLLTNPETTQLGIYHFVPKIAAFQMGYSEESINILLKRFEDEYDIIKYSPETSEVAVKNFLRHSIMTGGRPVYDCLVSDLENVKDMSLVGCVYHHLQQYDNLNATVVKFLEYLKKEILKDNDNDNERHVNESSTSRVLILEKPTDDKKKEAEEAEEMFEACWKAYPKKKGKGSVRASQKKRLLKDVGLEQMLRCIERYKEYIAGKDMQYVKDGSTFFNSGYVDYLDSNYDEPVKVAVGGAVQRDGKYVHHVGSDGRVWQ